MRRSTALMAQWEASTQTGESLHFEQCKGGCFSDREEYGLKVVGKTAQNGTPSPQNPVPIQCVKAGTKVKVCGKNLFDKVTTAFRPGNYNENGFVYRNISQGIISTHPIYLLAGNYCVSAIQISDVPMQLCIINKVIDGKLARQFLSTVNKFTITEEGYYAIQYNTNTITTDAALLDINNHAQIELGTIATSYEHYQGNEVTVPCDLYEGDVWYLMSGKVVKNNLAVVVDGTQNLRPYNTQDWTDTYIRFSINIANNAGINIYNQKADCFSIGSATSVGYHPNVFLWRYANEIYQTMEIAGVTDLVSAKAWYENHPVTYVARLTTPIIEQYDPQPVQAYPGTVNVMQSPTDLPADLSATLLCRR